jgi:phospholipase C
MFKRIGLSLAIATMVGVAGCTGDTGSQGAAGATGATGATGAAGSAGDAAAAYATQTPIKHLVVIFQENVSFDHYFATYPTATNPSGEPKFTASSSTPTTINTLASAGLLTTNPNNTNTKNQAVSANGNSGTAPTSSTSLLPYRLDLSDAATDDQDHDYIAEQQAFDGSAAGVAAMDLFPLYTGSGGTYSSTSTDPANAGTLDGGIFATTGQVMGYYDGNTVTAYWNYAQNFAMSDNSFGTNFGPSTDGAINLVSGQTNGVVSAASQSAGFSSTVFATAQADGEVVADGTGGYTLISDGDPTGDTCSSTTDNMQLQGKNIGDLLNAQGISWGFFEGGFNLGATNANGTTGCSRSTTSAVTAVKKADYIPHHQPFQYYASTCNPTHTRPASVAVIGTDADTAPAGSSKGCTTATPTANHQYDITDFFTAVSAGNFPAVSFLKAPGYQDGHAGYSDPLDEQSFVVTVINFLEQQQDWASTAVIIAYDDSDGWYDHVTNVINGSNVSGTDQAVCSGTGVKAASLQNFSGTGVALGRCGYGPRLPFLVISPYAVPNSVDHTVLDQSSIPRFIEDNWLSGTRITGSFDAVAGALISDTAMFNFKTTTPNPALFLDPATGLPLSAE